ncbi:MAG: GNAT family N-acetyltransferase [Chloroflexota bacterium]|nr:GNAT family N-acetyltransferase [Chloroflexota bacterium]
MATEETRLNPKSTIHQASQNNYEQLADFFNQYHYIHRHLDWFATLDLLGDQPFLFESVNDQIKAVICTVPENNDIAWIRSFGVREKKHLKTRWERLLAESVQKLRASGIKKLASLALHRWFEDLLTDAKFENHLNIIVLEWQGKFPKRQPSDLEIRSMTVSDLPFIEIIDHIAFPSLWQNSLAGLRKAYHQTGISTVAVKNGQVVGYQISTAMTIYGHLARLAVHPYYQRQGVGYAIVYDLLKRFEHRGYWCVTVNTQSNNLPSLKLYEEFNFKRTDEEIPVYELDL